MEERCAVCGRCVGVSRGMRSVVGGGSMVVFCLLP
jgi:hypothetical protein